jgi:hypothetical protein
MRPGILVMSGLLDAGKLGSPAYSRTYVASVTTKRTHATPNILSSGTFKERSKSERFCSARTAQRRPP